MSAIKQNHYELLGVKEDATAIELKLAYRRQALAMHPDKGGDETLFDQLHKSYAVLEDPAKRAAYDEQLAKERERALLVEGVPHTRETEKQLQAPMRIKTAPTPGSKNSKKTGVSNEWKGQSSGAAYLKSICDQNYNKEEQTQELFHKYSELPRGKEKKREWVGNLCGHEKAALKAAAKKHEEEARAKMNKWLNPAPKAKPRTRPAPPRKPAAVATPADDAIETSATTFTDGYVANLVSEAPAFIEAC